MLGSSRVFITHSSVDQPLAEALVQAIRLGANLPEIRVFCSSVDGSGIPTGEAFLTYIQQQLQSTHLVIPLITPAHLDSTFCMYELGASWVRDVQMLPLVVPPVDKAQLPGPLSALQARELNKRGADSAYRAARRCWASGVLAHACSCTPNCFVMVVRVLSRISSHVAACSAPCVTATILLRMSLRPTRSRGAVAALTAPTQPLSLASPTVVSWTGSDAGGSGLSSFDVRISKAAPGAGFSAWSYPTYLQHTKAKTTSLPAYPGYTSCAQVRANDGAGNAWSPQRCAALPMEDRSLSASAGWSRIGGSPFFAKTATSTTRLGATLVSPTLQTTRLALVATSARPAGSSACTPGRLCSPR